MIPPLFNLPKPGAFNPAILTGGGKVNTLTNYTVKRGQDPVTSRVLFWCHDWVTGHSQPMSIPLNRFGFPSPTFCKLKPFIPMRSLGRKTGLLYIGHGIEKFPNEPRLKITFP